VRVVRRLSRRGIMGQIMNSIFCGDDGDDDEDEDWEEKEDEKDGEEEEEEEEPLWT